MIDKGAADHVFVYHEVGLQNHAAEINRKIQALLLNIQDDILGQIRKDFDWASKSPARMRDLRRVIAELQREAQKALRKDMRADLVDLADYESSWAAGYYGKMIEATIALRKPSASMLKSFVTSNPFQGETLSAWARKMEKNQLERINRQLVIGMGEGEDVGEIVNRLKGTRALKYRDGQFAKDARGAEALVRTAVNHVSNQAHKQIGIDHSEEFPRYRWSSVLDHRTSPICRTRAGRIYDTGDGPVPPAHWNCRSRIAYISRYNDWDEEEPVYAHWLKDQPRDIVEDVLGKTRAKLYLEGKLPIDRFTNKSGVQWTLAELRQKEKKVWERTFGK
ncbi:MAG: hypothetical protein DSY80_08805 [Desulfocapsa sp.]|nr:MAG: hypothetical protein DSY80_08805 [Desulfocapsa sp.]